MPSEIFARKILEVDPSLKSFAMHLTHDPENARELLQKTHFNAISNEDKFTTGTNLKAWLFTIMKNIFINDYRIRCRRTTVLESMGELSRFNLVPATNGHEVESKLVMDDLLEAIESLESKYRNPFQMHCEGYKYQEIADALELHLGTVKSRIFFARKILKKKLGNRQEYLN